MNAAAIEPSKTVCMIVNLAGPMALIWASTFGLFEMEVDAAKCRGHAGGAHRAGYRRNRQFPRPGRRLCLPPGLALRTLWLRLAPSLLLDRPAPVLGAALLSASLAPLVVAG